MIYNLLIYIKINSNIHCVNIDIITVLKLK